MVGIKDFSMPSCCRNCEMFDAEEYGICVIIGDTQDFEYQWDENRPFDCPLVEAIPKADYEARLKADMTAMLTELQLDIEELKSYESVDGQDLVMLADIGTLFQQRINNLKED